MIVSHKYQFIFVRTQKTASTSIEAYLRNYIGDEDCVTEDRVEGWQAKNCDQHFQPHASYREIISEFGSKIRGYYSFAFDRNPWDRAVSEYYFKRHARRPNGEPIQGHELTLNGFRHSVINREHKLYYPNYTKYMTESGDLLVDNIFKYEDLPNAFHVICGKLGIPWRADEFGSFKTSTRPNESRDYKSYFDPDTEELIRKINAPMLRRLEYKF